MRFSHTYEAPATPKRVRALWTDVAGWPTRDADLVSAALDAPFKGRGPIREV